MNKHDFIHIQQDNMALWAEETKMQQNMDHINHLIIYIQTIHTVVIRQEWRHQTFHYLQGFDNYWKEKKYICTQMRRKWKAELLAQQFFQCNHLNQNRFISFSHRDLCLSNRSSRILEQHDITFRINRSILDEQWIHHDPTCSRIICREFHPIIG